MNTTNIDLENNQYYLDICLFELQNKYGVSDIPHTDKKTVIDACKVCIHTLVNEFENESFKLYSFQGFIDLLRLYSSINEVSDIPQNIKSSFKKTCRYIIGEYTKIKLTDKTNDITNEIVSNLICITNLIDKYIQILSNIYTIDEDVYQLELYKSYFCITIHNEEIHKILIKGKEIIERDVDFRGSCYSYKNIIRDLKFIEKCFGEVATKFFDIFYTPQDKYVDLSNCSEKEFLKLLSNMNRPCPSDILDYTELVEENPNDIFLNGLILRKDDVNLEESILKPFNKNIRVRFKPIIEIIINNRKVYLTTRFIIFEAFDQILLNLLPFDEYPNKWGENKRLVSYSQELRRRHDKWLEDPVEKLIKEKGFIYTRNIKSINSISLEKAPAIKEGKTVGEIDFILINKYNSTIYVIDCKFIKRKDNVAGFPIDKNSFSKDGGYNEKLTYKIQWIKTHKKDLQIELRLTEAIENYNVEGFFITDAFIYYSLFSVYPIMDFNRLNDYFSTFKH